MTFVHHRNEVSVVKNDKGISACKNKDEIKENISEECDLDASFEDQQVGLPANLDKYF